MQVLDLPLWLRWTAAITGISIALLTIALSVLKHRRETWPKLYFHAKAGNFWAEDEENGEFYYKGIGVTVTNYGRSLIVEDVGCRYSCLRTDRSTEEIVSSMRVEKKIDNGEKGFGIVNIHVDNLIEVSQLWATDSVGKQWNAPKKVLQALKPSVATVWLPLKKISN